MNWIKKAWETEDKDIEMHRTPCPQTGHLDVEHTECSNPEEVRKLLTEFDGDGWVMFTHTVKDLKPGQALGEEDKVILSAESVKGDESLHIRQSKQGWSCFNYKKGSQKDQWLFEQSFQRMPHGKLIYEVAWTKDAKGVFQPKISRLKAVETDN